MNQPIDTSLPFASLEAALAQPSRFASLPPAFYTKLRPTPLPEPHLIAANPLLLADLGLSPMDATRTEFIDLFVGNRVLSGAEPLAAIYAGHQFGVFVQQLGDGRAISLGDAPSTHGPLELQLKGAGPTPYSRRADGRAVLRSSIREYLCSEAMHGLGIPTTRALALIGADQPVIRETVESAAVVTRVAPSFVRFGSFELFYHRRQYDEVKRLADFVIAQFFPQCAGFSDQYERWFAEVIRRTARLMAQWQSVGFCHGVMNTDNMSILGLTLDYGPFGFMEAFDPSHICNHTDEGGRYAYNMQPRIGLWNLYALGQALVPLIEAETLETLLQAYQPIAEEAHDSLFLGKLGLVTEQVDDEDFLQATFAFMAAQRIDFTLFFRNLSRVRKGDASGDAAIRDLILDRAAADAWLATYRTRLAAETRDDATRAAAMNAVNPKYVLRNYLAETAISQARGDQGPADFSEIERLRVLLANPFDEQPEMERYAAPPPEWANGLEVSCSS